MVQARRKQRFPLGTRVSKYFNGFAEPFEGSVDQHSDVTNFYHISYDDGDSEEMTEDDVETYCVRLPSSKRTHEASKPQQILNETHQVMPPLAEEPSVSVNRVHHDNMASTVSVATPPVVSQGTSRQRPKVLSLNANAPAFVRITNATSSPCAKQAPLRVQIPETIVNENEEEEEEEEEEETIKEDDDCESDESVEGTPEEINELIGKPVERIVTKEGCGIDVVQGAVASYFPATKMFRVMYYDGECSDLPYHEVFNSIPADLRPLGSGHLKKRKSDERSRNGDTDDASPQLCKTRKLSTNFSASLKRGGSPTSPTIQENDMALIDTVEHNIVRKVLFIIVSTVNNAMMKSQLVVLSSTDLKDEEALKAFVRKDGLTSLAELISKWDNRVETEQGLLLVLKILAVLPGITKEAIMDSRIGKRVRAIEKRGDYQDLSIPGLASWVINKMKADVTEAQDTSERETNKASQEATKHSQGSNGLRRSTSSHRSDGKRDDRTATTSKGAPNTSANKFSTSSPVTTGVAGLKRSNSANHLLNLMNSHNGRNASTTRSDRDIFGNRVIVEKKRRLGTAQNWRARRSTVVLDQVTRRVTEKAQDVGGLKPLEVVQEDWKPSKITFAGTDSVCSFDKEVEVSKLLVFRPSGSPKTPTFGRGKPLTGQLKSILRVRLSPRPASRLSTSKETSAPPKIHVTTRSESDSIVVLSPRSRATLEATNESPTFNTSRLSYVVSPTEKKKHSFSPPPCIPVSEQPPLGFIENDENTIIFHEDNRVKHLNARDEELHHTAATTLSPVVSEDESADVLETSCTDTNECVSKVGTTNPTTCSSKSTERNVERTSAVQQVTTLSG